MAALTLRLVSGSLRGRRIEVPAGTRPTESRVREALLSIWRPLLPDSRFLDLFAGSGAVGFEALSLGAAHVAFVDAAPRALATLRRNLASLDAASPEASSEIVRGRLPEVLERRPAGRFDLVFADPPYAFDAYPRLVAAAAGRAAPGAEIAVEHSARVDWTDEVSGWRRHDRRRYGESRLSFYRREEE